MSNDCAVNYHFHAGRPEGYVRNGWLGYPRDVRTPYLPGVVQEGPSDPSYMAPIMPKKYHKI
jgi:hypothetical protein